MKTAYDPPQHPTSGRWPPGYVKKEVEYVGEPQHMWHKVMWLKEGHPTKEALRKVILKKREDFKQKYLRGEVELCVEKNSPKETIITRMLKYLSLI